MVFVCLSVLLYPIDAKTAEPRDPMEGLGMTNFQKFAFIKIIFF